jgi:hypothetical protein
MRVATRSNLRTIVRMGNKARLDRKGRLGWKSLGRKSHIGKKESEEVLKTGEISEWVKHVKQMLNRGSKAYDWEMKSKLGEKSEWGKKNGEEIYDGR